MSILASFKFPTLRVHVHPYQQEKGVPSPASQVNAEHAVILVQVFKFHRGRAALRLFFAPHRVVLM